MMVLDQTRPDVGLPVVKVIVPGLRHFWPRFGPGRLYDVPVGLGRLATPTREADLNPVPPSGMTLSLWRYAVLRRDGERVVAEGPGAGGQVPLADTGTLALVQAFAEPCEPDQAAAHAAIPPGEARELIERLVEAGVVVDAPTGAREDASAWGFHDLVFHLRSRSEGNMPLPPPSRPAPEALPSSRWSPTVELERPDLDAIERDDPPLARVQAARLSIREYGARPLTASQLGELLYRVGRVEDIWHFGPVTFAAKPYPAAGALYELELYVAVGACEGGGCTTTRPTITASPA